MSGLAVVAALAGLWVCGMSLAPKPPLDPDVWDVWVPTPRDKR